MERSTCGAERTAMLRAGTPQKRDRERMMVSWVPVVQAVPWSPWRSGGSVGSAGSVSSGGSVGPHDSTGSDVSMRFCGSRCSLSHIHVKGSDHSATSTYRPDEINVAPLRLSGWPE